MRLPNVFKRKKNRRLIITHLGPTASEPSPITTAITTWPSNQYSGPITTAATTWSPDQHLRPTPTAPTAELPDHDPGLAVEASEDEDSDPDQHATLSSTPDQRQHQNLAHCIRTLHGLLNSKLHGDHLLYPRKLEKALNDSILAVIHDLKIHPDLLSLIHPMEKKQLSYFQIHFWLLDVMVASWSDERALDREEKFELRTLMAKLENAEEWRIAISKTSYEDHYSGSSQGSPSMSEIEEEDEDDVGRQ